MEKFELEYNQRAGDVGEGETEQYTKRGGNQWRIAVTDSIYGYCKY